MSALEHLLFYQGLIDVPGVPALRVAARGAGGRAAPPGGVWARLAALSSSGFQATNKKFFCKA